jgi:hypothetical protein
MEKVSHGNQHPVQTWKPTLDGKFAVQIDLSVPLERYVMFCKNNPDLSFLSSYTAQFSLSLDKQNTLPPTP